MRDLDNHFGGYNHLIYLARADVALHILRKAASCVKPLMRKRGWRVGLLSEFLPEQPNLLGLNINRGEQIQVRLRYPGDWNQFLPFEQVLDTLLHELSHIVWGPHDQNFHRLWNELRDEWETLQIKGFSGEGFLGNGMVLGGHRIPVEEVRRKARAAAQERARLNKNKAATGHRLGGGHGAAPPPASRRRLRDLLASTAQSRNKASTQVVDSGCATGTQAGTKAADDALRNGFRTKAEMDDANSIAIAQALQELYEQEEDNRIYDGLSHPPAPGGLTWDPELGLQALDGPSSKPAARSSSQTRPASTSRDSQTTLRRDSVAPGLQVRTNSTSTPRSSGSSVGQEYNPHGKPISRLVREAESENLQRHTSRPVVSSQFTPISSLENWPTSATGANLLSPWSDAADPAALARGRTSLDGAGDAWGCLQCTFSNHGSMHRCEICEAPKPGVGHEASNLSNIPSRSTTATIRGASSSLSSSSSSSEASSRRSEAGASAQRTSRNGAIQERERNGDHVQSQPLGWLCWQCGNFMITEWWTCARCGAMKTSSS